MRTIERTEDLTRSAVVNLLKAERDRRRFFLGCCKAGVSRLWAVSHQFRDELQTRGEWHTVEEKGDVLLSLAREKLPESPAARWDAEWASRLAREALERLAEHYARLGEGECARLNLEAQDEFHEQMNRGWRGERPGCVPACSGGLRAGGCRGFRGGPEQKGSGSVSEQVGQELRRIREERGLTVEELAEKSGISATTIRAVEGEKREARGDTVAKLARPLGLTFDDVWRLQRRRG